MCVLKFWREGLSKPSISSLSALRYQLVKDPGLWLLLLFLFFAVGYLALDMRIEYIYIHVGGGGYIYIYTWLKPALLHHSYPTQVECVGVCVLCSRRHVIRQVVHHKWHAHQLTPKQLVPPHCHHR